MRDADFVIEAIIPLELEALPAVKLPVNKRTVLRITLHDGAMFAEVAMKSLRRAVSMIAKHGEDSVIVFVEGKLLPGNLLEGASLITPQKNGRHTA